MTRQSTLIHAAELLEREARLNDIVEAIGDLGAEHFEGALEKSKDMLQTARALRDMAVTTPFEPGCK